MGYVFKATQNPVGRTVALKVLKESYMGDQVIRDRFLREAEVIARMSHKNIVMLFDSGYDDTAGILFMAMEYLEGKELTQVLDENPDLTRCLDISMGIASALAEAHKNGIIHRDLKAENVFLIRDQEGTEIPKVLDFGFARLQGANKKLTQAGIAFGTPHYMAPEQAMGLEGITAAADVYAVGIMMFEMVTGRVPYEGSNAMEIMNKQVNADIPEIEPRPGLNPPARLLRLINSCMQKQPEDRLPDGAAVLSELQKIKEELESGGSSGGSALATTGGTSSGAVTLEKKHLVMLAAGFGVLIVIGIVLAIVL